MDGQINWFFSTVSPKYPIRGMNYGKVEEGIISLAFVDPFCLTIIKDEIERNRNLKCKFYSACLDFSWSNKADNFSCRNCNFFPKLPPRGESK